jgi:predicted  nucleic acid-binding Zn-ribbon protein
LEDVDGALRTINDSVEANQDQLQTYQNAATDIKDAYDAAIAPLQQQLDILKDTSDLAQKQADIQTRLQQAQLKGALQQAQGDPVRRAQLENKLDELDAAQKNLQLQERELTLNSQQAAIAAKARGEKHRLDWG